MLDQRFLRGSRITQPIIKTLISMPEGYLVGLMNGKKVFVPGKQLTNRRINEAENFKKN